MEDERKDRVEKGRTERGKSVASSPCAHAHERAHAPPLYQPPRPHPRVGSRCMFRPLHGCRLLSSFLPRTPHLTPPPPRSCSIPLPPPVWATLERRLAPGFPRSPPLSPRRRPWMVLGLIWGWVLRRSNPVLNTKSLSQVSEPISIPTPRSLACPFPLPLTRLNSEQCISSFFFQG